MIINLTPHAITLRPQRGEDLVIPPSGTVCRLDQPPPRRLSDLALGQDPGDERAIPVYGFAKFQEFIDLPAPAAETVFIVSLPVLMAVASTGGRSDVLAPGTGPQDGAIRDDKGQIVAVTRLVSSRT